MNGQFYNQERVAGIIETYCTEQNINESDFARMIGAHPTHLSRIKGGNMCSPELLQKIAAICGAQVTDLIRDEIPENISRELTLTGAKIPLPASV